MTDETVMKVLAIQKELDLLGEVKEDLGRSREYRLTYIEWIEGATLMDHSYWNIVDMDTMKYISEILDRHDKQIRQEIDDRINGLKKELEEL